MSDRTHAGRVAVVSGAARGIGRAVAEGLASRGAHVVAVDVLGAQETGDAIAASGGRCLPVVADAGRPPTWSGSPRRSARRSARATSW